MYDTKELEALNEKIQNEINAVLEKYRPLVAEAVAKEIPQELKLWIGMGTAFLEDPVTGKNTYPKEGHDFIKVVNEFQYRDHFNTGCDLNEINR
jgi:hypothetical protein